MQQIFTKFEALLSKRLSLHRLDGHYRHTDLCLEFPHPWHQKREVNAALLGPDAKPAVMLEFKYDKRLTSSVIQSGI